MCAEFERFYQLFNFVAALVIWDGFLSRVDRCAFRNIIEFMIEERIKDSLEFLMDNLPTVVHMMKYYTAKGPLRGGRDDFTDIANLMPRSHERGKEEAVSRIDELMRLTNPHKLLFDNEDSTFLNILRETLSSVSSFPTDLSRPTRYDLSMAHDMAIAEILYVNLFQGRENVTPKEISPEMEIFIQHLDKSILAGIMYRMKSGHANIIDSFLKKTDSLEKIKENPIHLLFYIQLISEPHSFHLDYFRASLILNSSVYKVWLFYPFLIIYVVLMLCYHWLWYVVLMLSLLLSCFDDFMLCRMYSVISISEIYIIVSMY